MAVPAPAEAGLKESAIKIKLRPEGPISFDDAIKAINLMLPPDQYATKNREALDALAKFPGKNFKLSFFSDKDQRDGGFTCEIITVEPKPGQRKDEFSQEFERLSQLDQFLVEGEDLSGSRDPEISAWLNTEEGQKTRTKLKNLTQQGIKLKATLIRNQKDKSVKDCVISVTGGSLPRDKGEVREEIVHKHIDTAAEKARDVIEDKVISHKKEFDLKTLPEELRQELAELTKGKGVDAVIMEMYARILNLLPEGERRQAFIEKFGRYKLWAKATEGATSVADWAAEVVLDVLGQETENKWKKSGIKAIPSLRTFVTATARTYAEGRVRRVRKQVEQMSGEEEMVFIASAEPQAA